MKWITRARPKIDRVPPWSERELSHKLADARKEVEMKREFGSRLVERLSDPQATTGQPQGPASPIKYQRFTAADLDSQISRWST